MESRYLSNSSECSSHYPVACSTDTHYHLYNTSTQVQDFVLQVPTMDPSWRMVADQHSFDVGNALVPLQNPPPFSVCRCQPNVHLCSDALSASSALHHVHSCQCLECVAYCSLAGVALSPSPAATLSSTSPLTHFDGASGEGDLEYCYLSTVMVRDQWSYLPPSPSLSPSLPLTSA